MAREIKKVAVIGAGVMGAAIAAHVTNAGLAVVLLDIVGKDPNDRSAIAKGAVEKMLKTEPAPFMSPRNAKLITAGNLEDDLNLLADCDWIVEAIIENLKIKHDLYAKLETVRKEGSRQLQHVDHPAEEPDRGPVRRVPARFRHHPLLQPAALYAALGASVGRQDRAGRHRYAGPLL